MIFTLFHLRLVLTWSCPLLYNHLFLPSAPSDQSTLSYPQHKLRKSALFLVSSMQFARRMKIMFVFGMSRDIFKVTQGVLFMICLLVSYPVSCLHCKHSSRLIFPQIPSFVAASWAIHVSWPGISFHEAVLIGRNYKSPLKSILFSTFN